VFGTLCALVAKPLFPRLSMFATIWHESSCYRM
jgi:hypothetical protein